MHKKLLRALSLLLAVGLLVGSMPLLTYAADITVQFTDVAFKEAVLAAMAAEGIPMADAAVIDSDEVADLTTLDLSNSAVADLAGLENLTGLTSLNLAGAALTPNQIRALDGPASLTSLNISGYNLAYEYTLPAGLSGLTSLDVSNCRLRKLDVREAATLTTLTHADNFFQSAADITGWSGAFEPQEPYTPATITFGTPPAYTATYELNMASLVTVAAGNTPNKTAADIVWSASGNANASISAAGVLSSTAAATGTVTVTATIADGDYPGVDTTASVVVTITPLNPITDITLGSQTFEPGSFVYLQPTILPVTPAPTFSDIEWSIQGNPAGYDIYTGTYDGTALGNNEAVIETPTDSTGFTVVATVKNPATGVVIYTKSFPLTIDFIAVNEIELISAPATAYVNNAVGLEAEAHAANPSESPTYSEVTWVVTSGQNAADYEIDGNLFTPKAAGTYTLNAIVVNGKAENTDFSAAADNPAANTAFPITITVSVIQVADIIGLPTEAYTDQDLTLSGTLVSAVEGLTPSFTDIVYSFVGGPGTVDTTKLAAGTFNADAPGAYSMKATVVNGSGMGNDKVVNFSIQVYNVAVEDITGMPSGVAPGEQLVINSASLTVAPDNATNKAITGISYVNDAQHPTTAGVTVVQTGNTFTATVTGTGTDNKYWIEVTVANGKADGTDYKKYFEITVSSIAVESMTVTPFDPTSEYRCKTNEEVAIVASILPADATAQEVTWELGDNITEISSTNGGKNVTIKPTKPGTYSLTATIVNGYLGGVDFKRVYTLIVENVAANIVFDNNIEVFANEPTEIDSHLNDDATVQEVQWSILNAGTTGATAANLTPDATTKKVILDAPKPGTITLQAIVPGGTAKGNNASFSVQINVINRAVTSIDGLLPVGTATVEVTANEELILSLANLGGTVDPPNATNKVVTNWQMVNTKGTGASIKESGDDFIFTAAKRGTMGGLVVVRAVIEGGKANGDPYMQDFNIQVKNEPAIKVVPNPNSTSDFFSATAGTRLQLFGTVEAADGKVPTMNAVTKWAISTADTGETQAVVSGTSFTAQKDGTALVTATVAGGNWDGSDFTYDIVVKVAPKPVNRIGNVKSFTNTLVPIDLSQVTIIPDDTTFTAANIIWSVTKGGQPAAGIDNATKTFTPELPGSYELTATITGGGIGGADFVSDPYTVSVRNVTVTSIKNVAASLRPEEGPFNLNQDGADGTAVVINPTNATAVLLNKEIAWELIDAGGTDAALAADGTLTITTEGTLKVKATIDQGKADGTEYVQEFTIYASNSIVSQLENVPKEAKAGVPLTLTGDIVPADIDRPIRWEIFHAGSTGATITDGKLTAKWAGTVVVKAIIEGGNEDGSDWTELFYITVTGSAAGEEPGSTTIPTKSLTVNVRKYATIDKTGIKGDITEISVRDGKIASVDKNGQVQGKKRGETVITYVTSTGQYGEVNVKVTYNFWQWLLVIFLFGCFWLPLK